jgi:Bromodomain
MLDWQLVAGYSKIVLHPVDLGHVCRGIRRRQYKCLRDVRLDMWRVFANCVKFHSHPHNKEAVPSFVSIALHLREYFNMLWQEFMLTSDIPEDSTSVARLAFTKRAEDRKRRIENSGVLVMTKRYIIKTAQFFLQCLERGGRVDGLDAEPVFSDASLARNADLAAVHRNLKAFAERLADTETAPDEYSLEEYYKDMHECFEGDLLMDQPALLNRINNRLERLFWKRTVPLHEGNTRGVGQSSIWGNVAATIWARENSKKPYWPALCLGILPPRDQREGWHAAVTERNESRLPEKLRVQLVAAKKKCELAQKRQNLSYFLVEFLGTHEFIWVRELDIVEKFDPADDPNKSSNAGGKKKRASRSDVASVVKSRTYLTALEECKWAQEEFENVLQDVLDDEVGKDSEEEEAEMNYSFSVLAQSDDEADDEDVHGFQYEEDAMSDSDAEEANYLLAHDGMLDVRALGAKKKAKKKPPVVPKKKSQNTAEKEKEEALRKAKADQLRKKNQEKEDKKELRELERRRKKRSREREKALRDEERKQKRRRASQDSEDGADHDLAWDKRARASAIAKAYLHRTTKQNEEYKSLALNGVLQMPSAMIDPAGLLGMALAFRAAAGVLTMPDDSEEQITKSTKPWAAIDSTSAATSAERTAQLEIKMKMLEKEIQRVRANTNRRRELAEDAVAQRLALDHQIEMDDVAARCNHFKRKKKTPSGKPSGVLDADELQDDDDNIDESMMDVDEDASLDERDGAVVAVEALADDEDDNDDEEEAVDDVAPVVEVVVAARLQD